MKVALGQINPTVGDIAGNVEKILKNAERAKEAGASLVIFPELAICGYPPMDLLLKDSFVQANLDGLHHIKSELKGITAMVGFVDINPGSGRPLYNALAYLEDGVIKAIQYKTLLPTYDVFDEDRYFEPASNYAVCSVNGVRCGLSICEDIWNYKQVMPKPRYQMDPVEKIVEHHPQLLVNISASPYALGKEHIRHELVRNQAIRHNIPVIYVNQVGGNDQLIFDGRSIVIDAEGRLAAQAKAFQEDLLVVELTESGEAQPLKATGEIRNYSCDRTVNALEALVLGTRDYVEKCGFKKAVVGLSGGIDSAVVAAIACRAIGSENVIGVAMPSPYSSQHSIDDAASLAKSLDIEMKLIPIEPAMTAFDQMLAKEFTGKERDVTEENIQARARGMILMSLSNKFGYLVLTTGNKSELAVGYCTLYGDMCGGLAVISDLPKMLVYDLARYINEEAKREIIPRSTIDKPPSAELRPGQTDQDSLPPYVVLDGILHAYIEQRRKPDEIVRLGYRPEVVMDVINRVDRNEYKRKQAAPGLKVTQRAFGVGWRMPIAQRFKESVGQDYSSSIKVIC
jgi:NAD+ synthase (glutamine-hydrolysing)